MSAEVLRLSLADAEARVVEATDLLAACRAALDAGRGSRSWGAQIMACQAVDDAESYLRIAYAARDAAEWRALAATDAARAATQQVQP